MLELFRCLVKQEKPSFIIDLVCNGTSDLSVITCKYAKNGKYFSATSWCTTAIISSSFAGIIAPLQNRDINILSDVADIVEYTDREDCIKSLVPSNQAVEFAIEKAQSQIVNAVTSLFCGSNLQGNVKAKFTFDPIPGIVFRVIDYDGIVGSFVLFMDGSIAPVMVASPRIHQYIDFAKRLLYNKGDVVNTLLLD